jgi:hypothetical protein
LLNNNWIGECIVNENYVVSDYYYY